MDTDRLRGAALDRYGRAEATAGRWGDDPTMRLDGVRRQAAGSAQQAYGQAKDSVRDAADRASDYAADLVGQGRRYVERGSRELNERVETNPVMAVILATFVGYLLGIATNASRR